MNASLEEQVKGLAAAKAEPDGDLVAQQDKAQDTTGSILR